METVGRNTFSKNERLCGKIGIDALLAGGRFGNVHGFRFCRLHTDRETPGRLMISVPKKLFKRAVKRNLLKRRMREAFRLQKSMLPSGTDLLVTYNTKELLDQQSV